MIIKAFLFKDLIAENTLKTLNRKKLYWKLITQKITFLADTRLLAILFKAYWYRRPFRNYWGVGWAKIDVLKYDNKEWIFFFGGGGILSVLFSGPSFALVWAYKMRSCASQSKFSLSKKLLFFWNSVSKIFTLLLDSKHPEILGTQKIQKQVLRIPKSSWNFIKSKFTRNR